MSSEQRTLVARALAADAGAARTLVALLHPVIQARVVRVLRRLIGSKSATWRVQVEDRIQDIFAALFEDGGRVLRSWDPERGLSLQNFVGLFAERRAISALRGGQRPGPLDDVTLDELADAGHGPTVAIEPALVTREFLETLLDRLRAELSPLGMRLFQLVYVEECSVEEIAASTGMTAQAIYAWRTRLRRRVSKVALELQAAGPPTQSPPAGGLGHER